MKLLLAAAATLIAFTFTCAQDSVNRSNSPQAVAVKIPENAGDTAGTSATGDVPPGSASPRLPDKESLIRQGPVPAASKIPVPWKLPDCCKNTDDRKVADKSDTEDRIESNDKFHWKPAIVQSLTFLAFQQSFRVLAQDKTRRELAGPFFRDWGRSVKNLRGWGDGDNVITNYVGHPLQGSFTGRIFINNSDRAARQEFGPSKEYWKSRMKALAWSAAWSTQFELGPISEATLGNVGLYTKDGHSEMAYVDLIVTPVVGTAVLVGEDAIDKYFLKNWLEKKSSSKLKIKIFRSLFTPTISISNMFQGRVPWKRDNRPL